jgi:protocatechuate 3,4-dioxygenase beta subunit
MRPIRLIVLLALLAPSTLAQEPSGTLTLRGVVVSATDVPLPRVHVGVVTLRSRQLASTGGSPLSERGVLTDDRGLFTIRVPAAASVELAFTKARYVAQTADIALRENVPAPEVRVRLLLAGAISGRVVERSGTSLMGTTVALRRVGAAPSAPPISTTTTNDLGEYRFGGLAEGRYAVTATPSIFALGADIATRSAIVEAAAVQAPVINVSAGTEVANINLTIDTPSELDREAVIGSAPDADATASLSGRVVGWDGQPIARAVVQAYRPFVSSHAVETDTRGRYRFDRLSPGEYTVRARKYGFIQEQYALDGTPSAGRFTVQKGQALSVDVMLTRGASISGTIVDEFGEPVQDVAVNVLPIQPVIGRQGLRLGSRSGSSRTDDRGQYRVSGLQPGIYVVQAVVGAALSSTSGYLPLFYPGTQSVDQATTTKVDFRTAATGIDLALRSAAAHTVSGVVVDSSGRPPLRGEVTLAVSERSGAIQTEPVRTNVRTDGSFELTNVGPGDYVVQATGTVARSAPAPSQQFGMSFITVTNNPLRMELRLAPGAALKGRVRYEGVPAGPAPILTLSVLPADRDRAPLRGYAPTGFNVASDGSFESRGVFGPALIRAQPQQNDWYLKSVIVHGQEIVDTPFDFGTGGNFSDIQVLISALGATVTGRVTDERAAPVRDSSVIVFSTFRDRWIDGSRWVKRSQSAENGAFTVTGLPPGDYWVAAVPRLDRTAELVPDPDVLDALSLRGVRISLGEGQSQELTLRLIRP